jgi:hypothetical protein
MSAQRSRFPAFLTAALALIVAAAPSFAQNPYRPYDAPNQVRLQVGAYEPSGEGDYWDATLFDFTGEPEDFEDFVVGVDYLRRVGDHWNAVFSFSGYTGETDQAYFDFVDTAGFDIVHTTTLDLATFTAGLNYLFGGPNARFRPYVGGGVGAYVWELTEEGDFIDFGTPDLDIFSGTFFDDGVAPGYYWTAGLNVGLTQTLDVFAEGRWHNADGELGGDLEGACTGFGDRECELDVGGRQLTAGLSWRF